jgi:hypothetical protein
MQQLCTAVQKLGRKENLVMMAKIVLPVPEIAS